LTDILYSYMLDKHIGMANIKKKTLKSTPPLRLITIPY